MEKKHSTEEVAQRNQFPEESRRRNNVVGTQDIVAHNVKKNFFALMRRNNVVGTQDFAAEHRSAVEKVLKACLVKMVGVARRQLTEFLDEGKYAGELDGNLRKELENRPKTNRAGEHAFDDLDHDMVTRRHSSLFNRNVKHM
ncbi:hypothetical protein ElyMa_004134200 [Elysia marginata]|uniref:Uncharacterized protein n=1 Tax=Elysia marginata TaxID=1093978 RepID=A0AAV4GFD2_9GAST|nr:hypothetical protein ElyMa_004134200 [Elysia marginata]